jgi:hypothetical protein
VEEDLPKPEDDSDEVAEWFNTQTDPEIAQAVAAAVAEARTPVAGAAIDPPPQYPPLSQQQQPPSQYERQQPLPPPPPPGPRHGG